MSDEPGFRMRKVLSIDEIIDRCKDMEIGCVISVDAPLVTALNSRYSNPLFGFAYTPLNIASTVSSSILGTAVDSDLEICHRMMHITGSSLRMVHSTLCKIRDIRRYTSDVSAHLLTRREKEIYDAFRQTKSLESVMESFDDSDAARFYDNRRVCVIDTELFSEIDKRIPPVIREDISNASLDDVKTDWFKIDTIYSIGNDRQIAEAVSDLINPENCNDVAIVLDAEGKIAEAIRSALYRRNIPFKNKLAVKDLSVIRNYLRFLNDSIEFMTIRSGNVRELFSSYGAYGPGCLSVRTDGYLLCKIGREHLDKTGAANKITLDLLALMRRICNGEETFLSVVEALPKIEGKSSIKILLRDMDLDDEIVTKSRLADLEYAVNNISDLKHNEQIPEDERRGVLIADCKNSTYIDRPLVFFIGLDSAWHNSPSGKDYIRDPLGFEEKEAMRLRILLQQGDRRLYIIRPATDGKETVPCQTFETIADIEGHPQRIEHFSDICSNIISGSWHNTVSTAIPAVEVRETPEVEKIVFSKSDYNPWCDCPVKYAFNRVLKNDYKETEHTLFGSYVHEFAEFAYCFPDLARDNFDMYTEKLLERYSGISSSCMEDFDRSKFRTIMTNALVYVTSLPRDGFELDKDNSKRPHPNRLIAEDERTGNRSSSMAESFLSSLDGHAFFAKPDMKVTNVVIDYKTGSAKKISEIAEGISRKKNNAEFQPLIYLKAMQEDMEASGMSLPAEFRLVYFGERVAETARDRNIGRCVRTVIFEDKLDMESLERFHIIDELEEECRDIKMYAPFVSRWAEVCDGLRIVMSDPDWAENLDTSAEILASYLGTKYKDTRYFIEKKVAKKVISPIQTDDTIILDRKYMDEFAEHIDRDAIDARDSLRLPLFTPTRKNPVCNYCDYRSVCMYRYADDMGGADSESDGE